MTSLSSSLPKASSGVLRRSPGERRRGARKRPKTKKTKKKKTKPEEEKKTLTVCFDEPYKSARTEDLSIFPHDDFSFSPLDKSFARLFSFQKKKKKETKT